MNLGPMIKFSLTKYLPLVLVEMYLISTLALLKLGPVQFRLHSEPLFWLLILMYHLFLILGYLYAGLNVKHYQHTSSYSSLFFYLLFFVGSFSILITYKNLMNSDTLVPGDFFQNIWRGVTEPAVVYVERMGNTEYDGAGKSRVLNLAYIFFAFSKFLFIYYFVWFWNFIGSLKKFISIAYSFFFITPGLSAGVNSVIFWFTLFLIFSIILKLFKSDIKRLKNVFFSLILLLLIGFYSFGNVMSQRGGGYGYFESSSPLGDIKVNVDDVDFSNFVELSILNSLQYTFVWVDFYLTQGYYGFSLILEDDFKWTYGFGNSVFLQRQLNLITGIDVGPLTYQRRNDAIWGENSMWHSFYGQFANDYTPLGVIFLMFLIGFLMSKVWISYFYNNNFFAGSLLPIIFIMIIFIPANNQVFGYIDSLSYFIIVLLLYLKSKYKLSL